MYESLFTAQGLTVGLYFNGPDAATNLGRFGTAVTSSDM